MSYKSDLVFTEKLFSKREIRTQVIEKMIWRFARFFVFLGVFHFCSTFIGQILGIEKLHSLVVTILIFQCWKLSKPRMFPVKH